MDLAVAVRLIRKGVNRNADKETWADLGAGSGLFTLALAKRLGEGSVIYAIDTDASALAKIESNSPRISIKKVNHNFVQQSLNIELLDGVVMANSLHFVKDKLSFLNELKKQLKPSGKIILVEYEMSVGNQWVPYPIEFNALKKLADEKSFTVTKLDEEPSVFGGRVMYSAVLRSV